MPFLRLVAASFNRLGCHAHGTAWACSVRLAIVALVLGMTSRTAAQTPTLADPALARKLQQRVTLTWTGQKLAAALDQLSDVQKIPIWLDRRVDAGAELDLSVNNLAVAAALDALAADERLHLGWTALRGIVYVGPSEAARELATLSELARESIAKAPADARRKWLAPALWKVERLSEPRQVLDDAIAAAGARLHEGAALPHDLWPARSLPGVPPLERAVLTTLAFDRAIELSADGRHARVTAIKRPAQLTRTYPASDRIDAAVAELTAADDSIVVRREGKNVEVAARWEDHLRIRPSRAAAPAGDDPDAASGNGEAPGGPAGNQRFTLRIAAKPVGPVLDQLAAQLGLTVTWDPALTAASPAIADTLVSCEVNQADLDGLLAAILTPAGLTFERQGAAVTIRAGE
jgi:hypothetical protein